MIAAGKRDRILPKSIKVQTTLLSSLSKTHWQSMGGVCLLYNLW